MFSSTGLSPSTTGRSRPLRLTPQFLTVGRSGRIDNANPTTLHTQPLPGITRTKFGLIRFRSPLLTESLLFSLPVGTENVSLPHVPSTHPIYSDAGNTTSLVLGFPIRTPSDHSSVDSSPRLIAASYVLHRLLVPRHPPYALHYLQQRCSRPLCNSQTTHTTQTHSSTSHPESPRRTTRMRYAHHLNSVYVLPRKKHSRVLSGPNSASI